MANEVVKSVTINSYLMVTKHKDGSHTVYDFKDGKVTFQGTCANVHVARSVVTAIDTKGYQAARHTLTEMNSSFQYFKETAK